MTATINLLALSAAQSERRREELIRSQEQTILRTASAACRRFVSRSDDEFSVALCAFSRAVDVYDESKGDFLPFAQMLIKRDLIDFFRSQKNAQREVSVAPHVLEAAASRRRIPLARTLRSLRAAGRRATTACGTRFSPPTKC